MFLGSRLIAKVADQIFKHLSIGSQRLSTKATSATNPLFSYTSGRWLWNEQVQMDARSRVFDVPKLQQAICEAVGASGCTSFTKIGEGNYNKAFRVELSDGRKVIAKIPHPNAGPEGFMTASEVAAMEFARTILDLPVPKLLAWSADDTNQVGAEYIIMEEAEGIQLHEVWQGLQLRAKCDIIREIVDVETKMLSLPFDRLGSLYFADSGIRDCKPAIVTSSSTELNDRVRSRFCIGPIVRKEFWEKERHDMHQYQGPWPSAAQYLESIARREIDWLQAFARTDEAISNPWQFTSAQQQDPEVHVALLRKFISAIQHIVPKDANLVKAQFWHPDFHAVNIFVDAEGRISSINDWQGAWLTPAFIGASPPPLLDYGVDIMMKLPDDFKQLDDTRKEELRYQVAQSILIHTYETLTAGKNPLMYKMMRHPHGKTLKQLEAFVGGTWDNCVLPFEQCLISVEREWEHFGADAPCPYRFSTQEIEKHYAEADAFNRSHEFWKKLRGILTDEGFTLNETFAEAVETVEKLREAGLAGMKGDSQDEFDRATRWVTDLRKHNELD